MRFFLSAALIVSLALLSACACNHDEVRKPYTGAPSESFRDPGNEQFMQAVAEYVRSKNGPANTRYEFTRVDLNGDGRREGIVLLKTPHTHWCNLNGCEMAIFKAQNDYFELVSEVAPVRGPLTVSGKTTNGWNDIIVRVSGRMDAKTKDVALQFSGGSYPNQPAFEPQIQYAFANYGGIRIFP